MWVLLGGPARSCLFTRLILQTLEHPQRTRQWLPLTALGGRGNFGTPQWAREDISQSRQISPNLGKFCPFAVSFVPLAKRSQRQDANRSY